LKFQGFDGEGSMRRAMVGAVMMGFGGMLAGGCSIGAGVSGGSIFVATAWLALLCMWIGAVLTDLAGQGGRPGAMLGRVSGSASNLVHEPVGAIRAFGMADAAAGQVKADQAHSVRRDLIQQADPRCGGQRAVLIRTRGPVWP